MCLAALYDAYMLLPVFIESFLLASNCLYQVSGHQQWARVVPHISLVVLRHALMLFLISSVAASATPADALIQIEDLEMIACLSL